MYFLYPWNDGIEKNLEKLIPVIKKVNQESIKIDLIFLWDEISKNLALRNLIIESSLQENIKFLGNIKISEKELLYKESLWVVFPSFYEPFPFELWEALEYNVPILSSSLKSIRSIFWWIIEYFSPIAKSSITNCIENFLKNKKTHTMDYKNIKNMYNKENTAKILLEIIK
jgi:glycosyltransferase involved in cell wall biosynthesis